MSYTIMIIDDEQMILDMLRDQFEMEPPWKVLWAGHFARQSLRRSPPQCLQSPGH